MADPISLGASIITLLGVCTASTKLTVEACSRIRNAPKELVALSNELVDLNVILLQVQKAHQADPSPVLPVELPDYDLDLMLAGELTQAQRRIADLDALVVSLRKSLPGGKVATDRVGWYRKRKSVEDIKRGIKTAKRNIHFLMSIKVSSATQRAEKHLQTIFNEIRNQQLQQSREFESVHTRIAQLTLPVGNAGFESAESQQEISDGSTNQISSIQPYSAPVSFQGLVTWDTQQYTPLTFQSRQKNRCIDSCVCTCHTLERSVRILQTPRLLESVIGHLFATFSGLPFLQPGCSDSTCRNYSSRAFQATYRFPKWVFAVALHIAAGNTTSGGFFNLSFQHRVPSGEENGIFDLCVKGENEGVKKLLENRRATPSDVDSDLGHSPLHVAIHNGKVQTIQLLLQFGANPDLEQDTGISVYQTAWSRIFDYGGVCTTQERQDLKTLFPETQALERFDFSDLHKAILRILQTDLGTLLSKEACRAEINYRDTWDRTPLHWAAKLGDAKAVELLIHAGAEVNVKDRTATTPTHYAAIAPDPKALELLLMARSDVRARNWRGEEPIHYAVRRSTRHVRALLTAKATLHPTNGILLSGGNDIEVARFLIKEGFDIELLDSEGNTALFRCLKDPYHQCLGELLAAGANVNHVNKSGYTMLHCAARYAEIKTLDILCASELRGVDTGALDAKGRTAMELLETRLDPPASLHKSFSRLVASIKPRAVDDEEDVEEYFDAIQTQDNNVGDVGSARQSGYQSSHADSHPNTVRRFRPPTL